MPASTSEQEYPPLYFEDARATGEGSAPPFVLVHGLGRSSWFWRDWVPVLGVAHRVIRPDLPGCGRSQVVGEEEAGTLSLEAFVRRVLAFFDRLGLTRVHYIGESAGGIIGSVIAARHPARVASLTLVSTPVHLGRGSHDQSRLSPGAASPVESLRTLGLRRWWFESRALTDDLFGDERDEQAAEEFALTPLPVATAMWEAMHASAVELLHWASDIKVPTLLLSPGRSVATSIDEQRELLAALPSGTLRVYPEWTHGMYFLHPTELARQVLPFATAAEAG
jgi:pimeloyl-ACP methyl ester carboxylesterase